MSNPNSARWFDFRLDVAAALLGLVVAVLMVPLRLLASQVYIETLPIVLAVACLLYLLSVRTSAEANVPTLSTGVTRLLPSVAFLGMAAMVIVAIYQARSALFYYITVWTGIVVLAQVVFGNEREYHVGLLLIQVFAFGAVVRLAGAITTPGYVGIDIWTHVGNWVPKIKAAGSLAPINDSKYYASPLFHLYVALGSQLLDVSIRHALILTIGVVMPLAGLLVYATANVLVKKRWAVFAAAAFTMSGNVIEWGIHMIPTSLGLLFYVAILYSLTRIMATSYRRRDFLLVVLFSIAVILTHQISSFIMLVFVGSGLLAKLLLSTGLFTPVRPARIGNRVRESTNLTGLIVFDLGLITFMWSLTPYKGSTFLETVLSYFVEAVKTSAGFLNLAGPSGGGGGGGAAAGPTLLGEVVTYINAGELLLLLLLAIVGSLYVLHRERISQVTVTNIVAIVVMLLFIFGFPLFGIRTFVPGRWVAFLMAPLAVIGAIGIGYIAGKSPRSVAVVVLVLFVVAYPATALISSQATLDDPAFSHEQTRYSYTESELAAVDTISRYTDATAQNPISTDHPLGTVFSRAYEVNVTTTTIVDGTAQNRTVVYRRYARSGAEYYLNGRGQPYQPRLRQRSVCRGYGVAYDDGSVAVCQQRIGT